MPKKNGPAYADFLNLTPEELSKMKGDAGQAQLRKILSVLRRGISARKGVFTRSGVYSGALHQYRQQSIMEQKNHPRYSQLTRNQLIMEIVRAQQFYSAKTSSISGVVSVQRAVEDRLFGKDSHRFLTNEEMSDYWAVYNEFVRLHPDMMYRLSSESVQQALAQLILDERVGHPGEEDFNLGFALDKAEEFLDEWEFEHM